MTDKDKIRAFIEERKKSYSKSAHPFACAKFVECEDILSFIDTLLEEKVSEDLEEIAKQQIPAVCPYIVKELNAKRSGFILGVEWKEEQMMKQAVETTMQHDDLGDLVPQFEDMSNEYSTNEKVKVIIIKEE